MSENATQLTPFSTNREKLFCYCKINDRKSAFIEQIDCLKAIEDGPRFHAPLRFFRPFVPNIGECHINVLFKIIHA